MDRETVGHRVHYYNNVLLSIHCICYCDCGQVDSDVMLAARGGKSSLVTKQNTNWFPGHWTMGPSHPDRVWVWVWHCPLADLSKHRPLGISLESNSVGEGKHWCKGVPILLVSFYFSLTNSSWLYLFLFSLLLYKEIKNTFNPRRTNKLLRQLALNSLW